MRIPSQEEFVAHLQAPHFRLLTDTIDALGLEGYIVGGYVRDYILKTSVERRRRGGGRLGH